MKNTKKYSGLRISAFLLVMPLVLLLPEALFAHDGSAFHITGSVANSSGAKAYLVDFGLFYRLKDNGVILDSCEIIDDKFEFQGNVDFPMFCAIKIPEKTLAYRMFVLESGEIDIQGNVEQLHLANVAAEGAENELYDRYESHRNQLEQNLAFIAAHPNSLVSLHIVDMLIFTRVDHDIIRNSYLQLSEDIRGSEMGQLMEQRIEQEAAITWTTLAPFEGEDIYGEQISFADLKGKYLVIDFWATWCQPCVAEMPKMVDVYKKYGDNVEIVSVSLDRNIDLCKQRIEDLGMTWRQICQGDASRGELPLMFNVNAVPRVIIFDQSQEMVFDSASSKERFYDFLETRLAVN